MSEEEIKEIFNNLKEYIQDKINNGDHKIFYNDLGWDVKCVDCITAMDTLLELYNKQKEENNKNYYEWRHLEAEVSNNYISKDTIRDMQIQREFELQQEYEDFEDDIEWQTYKKLLED